MAVIPEATERPFSGPSLRARPPPSSIVTLPPLAAFGATTAPARPTCSDGRRGSGGRRSLLAPRATDSTRPSTDRPSRFDGGKVHATLLFLQPSLGVLDRLESG